jgi:hypothetical protein
MAIRVAGLVVDQAGGNAAAEMLERRITPPTSLGNRAHGSIIAQSRPNSDSFLPVRVRRYVPLG